MDEISEIELSDKPVKRASCDQPIESELSFRALSPDSKSFFNPSQVS